jgi:hypothetical protein
MLGTKMRPGCEGTTMSTGKTALKIVLDWSRLLGFDQAPRDTGEVVRLDAPALSKVGGKIGVKVGAKTGSKSGLKRGG